MTIDLRKVIQDGRLIPLGISGETGMVDYVFCYGDWAVMYGEGTLSINHQRPGDDAPYPCNVTVEDAHKAVWHVTATDTQYSGMGRLQVVYITDGVVKKTMIGNTVIEPSLGENVASTPAIQSYIDRIVGYMNDIMRSVGEAEDAAEEATAKAGAIENMTVSAEIKEIAGEPTVTVKKTEKDGTFNLHFTFGIDPGASIQLAQVAYSGKYADLTGKPKIPKITISTEDPSGGADGDVWIKVI